MESNASTDGKPDVIMESEENDTIKTTLEELEGIILMENIVDRYNDKVPDSSEHATVENVEEPDEMNALKAEVAKLRQETGRMMGKELEGMNFKELQKLEHQLTEGILFVKNKKEQVLLEPLEKSRLQSVI
ncbi:agamous-like MADS-box protein AGL18 [Nicotiana tomentosiformis]|uniref:agamous-like MADS-box protein AGL18 n=1 Tax=Nicotiana tomentosiformis TaxID=4098 RepID=UPI00388CCB34